MANPKRDEWLSDDGMRGGWEQRNKVWDAFVAGLSEEEKKALQDAGFSLKFYHADNLAKAHRHIYDDKYVDKMTFLTRVTPFADSDKEVEGALASVVAKVIAAYGCTNDPKVLLHNDCFRIALGYTNYASMADLAKHYKVTRATISYRVKTIQKELGLPPSIYMRSEETCIKARDGQLKRKR